MKLEILVAIACVAAASPSAAQSVKLSELFGERVQAVAGVKSPAVRGDFDGDGKADAAYWVTIAPVAGGRTLASDVHVLRVYDGLALGPQSAGHGVAIVLNDGAQKWLVVSFQSEPNQGFFESPSWSAIASWDKTFPAPLHAAKRLSAALKTYPCLGKATKGDVLLFRDEAGIDEALAWTGKTFKTCVDPDNDP